MLVYLFTSVLLLYGESLCTDILVGGGSKEGKSNLNVN